MSHARNKTENSSICKGKGENSKQKSTKEKKSDNLILGSRIDKKKHVSKEKEKKKEALSKSLKKNSVTRNKKTRKTTENCTNEPQIVSDALSPCLSDKISSLESNVISETDSERVSPVRERASSTARNKKIRKPQNSKNISGPQTSSNNSSSNFDKISDSELLVISEADSGKVSPGSEHSDNSCARKKTAKKQQKRKNDSRPQIPSDNSPCAFDKLSDTELIIVSEADSERLSPDSKQNSHCDSIPELSKNESRFSSIKNTVSPKKLHLSSEAESRHVTESFLTQKSKCNVSVIPNVFSLNKTESDQFANCYSATLPDIEINYETDISDLLESDSTQNTVIDNSNVLEQNILINPVPQNIPNDCNLLQNLSVPDNYQSPKKCFMSLMNQKNLFVDSKQNFICNELKIEPIIKPEGFNYEQNNPFHIAVDISMLKAAYDYINKNSKSATLSASDIFENEWQDSIVKSSDVFSNFSRNESRLVSEDESEVSISSCKTADIQPEFFDSTFSENVSFSQEVLDYAINGSVSPIVTNTNEMCSVPQSQPLFEHPASLDGNDEKCASVKPQSKKKRKRRSQLYYSRKRRCRKGKQDVASESTTVSNTEFCDTCDEEELEVIINANKGQKVNEGIISEPNIVLNTEFCGNCDKNKEEESTHEEKKCQKVSEGSIFESNNVLNNEFCDENETEEPIDIRKSCKANKDVISESDVLCAKFCDTFDSAELEPIDSISPDFSHLEKLPAVDTTKSPESITDKLIHHFGARLPYVIVERLNSSLIKNHYKICGTSHAVLPSFNQNNTNEKVSENSLEAAVSQIESLIAHSYLPSPENIKSIEESNKNFTETAPQSKSLNVHLHLPPLKDIEAIEDSNKSLTEVNLSQAESLIAHSHSPLPKSVKTIMKSNKNLTEATPSQTESLISHSCDPSPKIKVTVEGSKNLTEESFYEDESQFNCDVSSEENTKAVMVIQENSHKANLFEVESLRNDNSHFSSPKHTEATRNSGNSTENSLYHTESFINPCSPPDNNDKVIVKTNKNYIEASLSQSEPFINVNSHPSSPNNSELSDDHITEAVVLGVSDEELDFEPDHLSENSSDSNASINNSQTISKEQENYFQSISNSVIESHLDKVTKANMHASHNVSNEKNKVLYSSVYPQKVFLKRHERDMTPFEDDSDSDEEHSFKRSRYEHRSTLIQENNLDSLKINQENHNNFSEQNDVHVSDESHSRNSDEIAHQSFIDMDFQNSELLKTVEEQSTVKSYETSNSSETKVLHDNFHHLKDVVTRINEYCYKQMGSEAFCVAQKYIGISCTTDVNITILKKLLYGIFSFIVKPDNSTSISNILDDILKLMHKFDMYNKQISSYFIVKCCEQNELNIFSEKMLNICQQKSIPLNSKAIKAFSLLLKLKEMPFSDFLDYLYYIKYICKKSIPQDLMHLALKRSKTCRIPEMHNLCSLLYDITSKEVDVLELKEFLQFCFKTSMFPYIADMFMKWRAKNSLSLCIYMALATEHECIGKYYWKFAEALYGDDKQLFPEQNDLFGQIGIALMLEAFCKKQMESALEILNILHTHNVNYFESQIALCKFYLTQPQDQSNNFDAQIFPYSVVFIAVDICLYFKRPKDAFTIFQDFSWVNPDENLSEAVKTHIFKERYHRLLKLVPLLNNEDTLPQGWEVLKILLTAIEQDLVDLKEESFADQYEVPKENLEVSDSVQKPVQKPLIDTLPSQKLIPKKASPIQNINSIYNEYLTSLINADKISSAFDLYKHSLGPKKDIFFVSSYVLRGLVVAFSNHGMTNEANSVFLIGHFRQVYSIKKPKHESFPWDLTIRSEWTVPEIKLVVELFVKTLFPLLSNKPKETNFENWFSIKILFKVINVTKSRLHCLSETNLEPNYYINKTKDALQNMNPCLQVTEEGMENSLLITSESLYNYWINNCPDASPKFPSSGRPPLEIEKMRLPFGANNDRTEKEASVTSFLDEGSLSKQMCSPHKPYTSPAESSGLMQMINDIRNKSYSPISPKTSPYRTHTDLQNISSLSCLMPVFENSPHVISTNTQELPNSIIQVKTPVKQKDTHDNKHKIHGENDINNSLNYVKVSSGTDLNKSQSEIFIATSPKTDSAANNSLVNNEPCFSEKGLENVIKPLEIISSNKLSPQKLNSVVNESLEKKIETLGYSNSQNSPIVFTPGAFTEPTYIRNKKVRKQINKLAKRQKLSATGLQCKKAVITTNAKSPHTPNVKNKPLISADKISGTIKKMKKCDVNGSNTFENLTVSFTSNTSTRTVSNCSQDVSATSHDNKINSHFLVQIPAKDSNSIFKEGSCSSVQKQPKFCNSSTVIQNTLNKPIQGETKVGSQLIVKVPVTDSNVKRPEEIIKEPITVSVTSSKVLLKPKEPVPNENSCLKNVLLNKVPETAACNSIPVGNTSNKNILLSKLSETRVSTIIPLQKKCATKSLLKNVSEITAPNNVPVQHKFYKPVLKRNNLASRSENFNENEIEIATKSNTSINNISCITEKRESTVVKKQKLPIDTVSLNRVTSIKSLNSSCSQEEFNKIIQFLEIKIKFKHKHLTSEEHHRKAISLAQAFIKENKTITKLDKKAMKLLMEFEILNV